MVRKRNTVLSSASFANSKPSRSIFTCSNCLEQFECGDGIAAPKIAGFSLTNKMTNGTSQISVLEAIATIFNINIESDDATALLQNLEVCLQCGSHLADMYKYYQEFLQLSAKDSGIYELIRLSLRTETKLTEEQVQNIADKSTHLQTVMLSVQQTPQDYIKHDEGSFLSTNPNARISKRLSMKRTLREVECDLEGEDTNYAKIQKVFSGRRRARSMSQSEPMVSSYTNSFRKAGEAEEKSLQDEENKDNKPRPLQFICPSPGCGKAFGFRHSLGNHVKTHLPKVPNNNKQPVGRPKAVPVGRVAIKKEPVVQDRATFFCAEPGCGKKFTFKQSLNRHMKKHTVTVKEVRVIKYKPPPIETKNAGKPFSAFEKSVMPILSSTDKNSSQLKGKAVQALVAAKNPHNCDFCTASFQSVNLLNQHLLRHRFEASNGPFACTQCGQVYRTKADLRKHKSVSHKVQVVKTVSKYVKSCPICKKDYLRPKMLVSHLVVKHKLSRDRALKKVGIPVPKAAVSSSVTEPIVKTKFSTADSAKLPK